MDEEYGIKAYKQGLLISIIIAFIGIAVIGLSTALKNLGILILGIGIISIGYHLIKIPKFLSLKKDLEKKKKIEFFYDETLRNLVNEFKNSVNWERGQNINLLILWIKY